MTAFCLNIAQYVAAIKDNPTPVGVFSMEMSKEQLVTRLLSSESEIDHSKLRAGMLSQSSGGCLRQRANSLASMFIDDSPSMSVLEVRARARRLKKEHGLGLMIVDYLQLMKGRTFIESRVQEISEITVPQGAG